ncbi:hypothetical protein HED51_04630 [Ochrobactrum grignonense]|nr:hypothetical protein [Brucella grignonensis]
MYGAENADFKDLLYPMVVLSRAHEESVAKVFELAKHGRTRGKTSTNANLQKYAPLG